MDRQLFLNPPASFREIPFWSWNDDLDENELKRQIAGFKQGGCGGFFMHARVGLKTPYLGPKWMRCVRASIAEAERLGLEAWLYDEDKWPSGFAGGLSVAAHPEYRAQYLVCKVDDRPALLHERIALFQAREEQGRLVNIRRCAEPELKEESDRLIQFYIQVMPLGDPWYNGFAYLNLLNPDAVRAFLESTHEAYAREIGEYFGSVVPGIFTDEPCTLFLDGASRTPVNRVPWDSRLPEVFRQRRGYDLLPDLPSLFIETGDYLRVRYDFWRTVTELFVEAYTRQIYQWCTAHRLFYTGHYMSEDTMLSQIQWGQATSMPHYAEMHLPGIDKLGCQIGGNYGSILTVKQLDSVVCQTGKPRALCENFGAAGQSVAHRHRKWLTDWAFVLGVNLSNPHLSMYSLRGERKRDYPAFLSYQQPWWPDNDLIADYVARLSYVMSQGERVVDILVLHPMGSAWAQFQPDGSSKVAELDEQLNQVLAVLLEHQRDFHLGDELLMAPGAACDVRVTRDGAEACLNVGKMAYRVVVVPPALTIASSTAAVLTEFARLGGTILVIQPRPTMVDCRPAEPVLPAAARDITVLELPQVLDDVLPFDVQIPNQPHIWVHHRRQEDLDAYFLANTSLETKSTASVLIRGLGVLEEWELSGGEVGPKAHVARDGVSEVVLDFAPGSSHLLVMRKGNQPSAVGAGPCACTGQTLGSARTVAIGAEWNLELAGPNALILDKVNLRLREHDWSPPMDILDAQTAVKSSGTGTSFALRFSFEVSDSVPSPVHLVLETPEAYAISINGTGVNSQSDVIWWTDISFRKLEVSKYLRSGNNEIVLSGIQRSNIEIESVYLIGDFGVFSQRIGPEGVHKGLAFERYSPSTQIVRLPSRALPHSTPDRPALDLTAQGLLFFAGTARLSQTVQVPDVAGSAFLEIVNLHAAVARIRVNGQLAGRVAWPPTRVEVTGLLRPGTNFLEIELVSTLRNLLGPHHVAGGDREITSPNTFRDKRRWTDDYILMPFGFNRVVLQM